MNPVCDQGLRVQPGGVELVGEMLTPEPDQNQPGDEKKKNCSMSPQYNVKLSLKWPYKHDIFFWDNLYHIPGVRRSQIKALNNGPFLCACMIDWLEVAQVKENQKSCCCCCCCVFGCVYTPRLVG